MKNVFRNRFLPIVILVVACLLCRPYGVLAAERALRADEVKVTTPVYEPVLSEFKPPLGRYTYNVTWQGVAAATAEVFVEKEGDKYEISTQVRTSRAVDLLYKLRFRAVGLVAADTMQPVFSTIEQRENSRRRRTEITFLPNGEILSKEERRKRDTEYMRFNPDNFTLDPFSAAFLARSLTWQVGETKYFDTFNGRHRYLIGLTVDREETMRVNGEDRAVWVIVPSVEKLTDRPGAENKLRRAEIFVTADSAREILAIRSEVFIGSVRTQLESFAPSPRPGERTSIADSSVVGRAIGALGGVRSQR